MPEEVALSPANVPQEFAQGVRPGGPASWFLEVGKEAAIDTSLGRPLALQEVGGFELHQAIIKASASHIFGVCHVGKLPQATRAGQPEVSDLCRR